MSECPPTTCPVCSYALTGLPPPHRCPECGFAYDENTRVWREPPSRFAWMDYALPIICVAAIVYLIMPVFRWRAAGVVHLVSLGAVLLFLSWLIPTFVRQNRSKQIGRCVALSPAGIFVRNAGGEEWVPWQLVGWVKFSSDFQFIQHVGSSRSTNLPGAFYEPEAREEFTKQVARLKSHYMGASVAKPVE